MTPIDAARPDDPVETPSARTYERRPVTGPPDARSPGATEPGDMGSDNGGDAGHGGAGER